MLDVREQLAPDRVGELVIEDRIPGEEARVEDAGEDGVVGAREFERIRDGPRRAADREARVPEPELDPLGEPRHVRRDGAFVEQQQVDVRVDRHLAARVAADGEQRRARRHAAFLGEPLALGDAIEAPHQAIHQIGVEAVHARTGARSAMHLGEVLARRGEVAADRAQHVDRIAAVRRRPALAEFGEPVPDALGRSRSSASLRHDGRRLVAERFDPLRDLLAIARR